MTKNEKLSLNTTGNDKKVCYNLPAQIHSPAPGRKGTIMPITPEAKAQILELFQRLTDEQQTLAVDFVLSMLEAGQEEAAADPE